MHKYQCQSWQGLIQMLTYLISRGYYYYCITEFPEQKRERWTAIDSKLIDRYSVDLSKWQRARRKKDGRANYYYLRWESISLVLHTSGELDRNLWGDIFCDVRKRPILLKISRLIEFIIAIEECQAKRHVFVRLSKETYTGLKAHMHEIAKTRNVWLMAEEIKRLNGLPAYSLVIRQKRQLAAYVAKQAKKHQVFFDLRKVHINTKLTRYPVYVRE